MRGDDVLGEGSFAIGISYNINTAYRAKIVDTFKYKSNIYSLKLRWLGSVWLIWLGVKRNDWWWDL